MRDSGGEAFVGELDGERVRRLAARSMIAWLSGEGRRRSGEEHELAELTSWRRFRSPRACATSTPSRATSRPAWRLRGAEVPEYWYEAPVFYFSNPASIRRPGGSR